MEQEARFFKPPRSTRSIRVGVTGMGVRNTERNFQNLIAEQRPALVLTCGFAGGLRPDLVCGAVLFACAPAIELQPALLAAGARPGRFFCAPKIAATIQEKRLLREETGADAVEMESAIIADLCRRESIACCTIRVVLDTAEEDLPLDFNQLMTSDYRIDYLKLTLALARAPHKIGSLVQFGKRSAFAARKLAEVLQQVLQFDSLKARPGSPG